jgi:hypothetical protein
LRNLTPDNPAPGKFWGNSTYKKLADEWTIFYNGLERLVPVASGEINSVNVLDEALFSLFKRRKL